jgi:hypothetical protein
VALSPLPLGVKVLLFVLLVFLVAPLLLSSPPLTLPSYQRHARFSSAVLTYLAYYLII